MMILSTLNIRQPYKKKCGEFEERRENILFQTNGKSTATVNVTIKEKDNLRTTKGKMEQS